MSPLTDYLVRTTSYSEATVESVIEAFVKFLQVSLRQGENVKLEKFGTFSFKDLPERPGRNPRTGESITLSASRRPRLKFSKKFVESVQPPDDAVSSQAASPALESSNFTPPPIPPELRNPKPSNRIWNAIIDGNVVEIPESELHTQVTPETPLWCPGRQGWQLLKDIPELHRQLIPY